MPPVAERPRVTPERRILLRDLGLGCWTLVVYATSIERLPGDWQSWLAIAVGGIAALAFAYAAEHADRFDGLVENLGPHRVAVLAVAIALSGTVAAIAGVFPVDFLVPVGFGVGLAVVGYRVVFGLVRPIPVRLLERERETSGP